MARTTARSAFAGEGRRIRHLAEYYGSSVPVGSLGGKADDKEGNSIAVCLRGGKGINEMFRVDGVLRYRNKDLNLDGQATTIDSWPDL